MIDREKVIKGLEEFKADLRPFAGNHADWDKFDKAFILLNWQAEKIDELRETIMEMSTNGGTGTQQDVCRFLLNLMDVIDKRHEAMLWEEDKDD